MKKIGIFINSFRGGGAERIVTYLFNEGEGRYEFHLIMLEKVIEYKIPDSVKIVELERGSHSSLMSVLKMPQVAKRLRNYLEENRIDTVLSLLTRANLVACRAKKKGWKGKLIISERTVAETFYGRIRFGWIMLRLMRSLYKQADVVTCISKGIAMGLQKMGIHNTVVIYNALYPSPKTGTIEKEKGGPFTFINIGRLEQEKDHFMLLTAFSKLKDKQCRLIILGKGPMMDELKEFAAKSGLNGRVEFAGFQKNVNPYLEKADCFVFSSAVEGFGNVLIEAMDFGLPVISTDCPFGPREILAPDTATDKKLTDSIEHAAYGVLSPVGNAKLFSEAMEEMMVNDELRNRYALQSRKRSPDFDIKNISRQYFELFSN
jgi:N-acetylgalactosamine-N,N'-diacetylbacillosaminyl-diphospho-undecaprenol 4-alpha-N-acetylgalactosaminyltransferase